MASIKFSLQTKSENAQIYMRLSISKNLTIKRKTSFSIKSERWSKSKGFPINTIASEKKLLEDLKKLETFVFANLNDSMSKGTIIDGSWLELQIKSCFNRIEKTDDTILINYLNSFIENANTRKIRTNKGLKIGLSPSTVKNYNSFKKIILQYESIIKMQIRFSDLSKPFIEKFQNWLVNDKEYSTNYSGKQLEILKTICIDAEKNELTTTPYSKKIEHFRESDQERYIQTLSDEEIEVIKNADFTNQTFLDTFKIEHPNLCRRNAITTKSLHNVRNWILLGCEAAQRRSDLLEITPESFRYKDNKIYLDVEQIKTKKSVSVPIVVPHVIDIIENDFPFKISYLKLAEMMKVVCKLSGIDTICKGKIQPKGINRKILGMHPKYELITPHCLRRTFATKYYKKIPTPILMGITGHSKESIFVIYINQRVDKDANADLFRDFYDANLKEKEPQLKIIREAN